MIHCGFYGSSRPRPPHINFRPTRSKRKDRSIPIVANTIGRCMTDILKLLNYGTQLTLLPLAFLLLLV